MSDTVILTVRCRKRGLILRVVEDNKGVRMIDTNRYNAGPNRQSWTYGRFLLRAGSGRSYGCHHGWAVLILDKQLITHIRQGNSEWILDTPHS